jgi:hypothetical protein
MPLQCSSLYIVLSVYYPEYASSMMVVGQYCLSRVIGYHCVE